MTSKKKPPARKGKGHGQPRKSELEAYQEAVDFWAARLGWLLPAAIVLAAVWGCR